MKIAIIGTGISGLVCAHLLHKKHNLTIFEANDYVGGHTHTVDVNYAGKNHAIDTGFIVFNDWTYPNFIKLLKNIDVDFQPTSMSFSVTTLNGKFEYNGNNLNALFSQRMNLFRPFFWIFIRDILRFNKNILDDLKQLKLPSDLTLGDYLKKKSYSTHLKKYYLSPMISAIWSTGIQDALDLPVFFFAKFFSNHGLLNINNRPTWQTIVGGSREYVKKIITPFEEKILLSTPVKSILRHDNHVEIITNKKAESFDQVIIATHSNQALQLLKDPSEMENDILKKMSYQSNEVVLHTDRNLLPKNKRAWASWNYLLTNDRSKKATVTYNMNILQNFHTTDTFCVTLNNADKIKPDTIIQRFDYSHPVFTKDSIKAQKRFSEINGVNKTYFCGAYWGNGFHEDGVNSALKVASYFGETLK